MLKYLGSKRLLIDWINNAVNAIVNVDEDLSKKEKYKIRIYEPFAGSCRVGYSFKKQGFFVIAGDYLEFVYVIAKSFIEADRNDYPPEKVLPILNKLQNLEPVDDWFVQRYSKEALYFQHFNAQKIAAIRIAIDKEAGGDETLRAILLTSLLLAADAVDSTVGIQMAFLKRWAPRSYSPIKLEYPELLPGKGMAYMGDALEMASQIEADIAYLDPPYNQHSYARYYHVWETLVKYDNPPVYGVVRKRLDAKNKYSPFNYKNESKKAMKMLLSDLKTKYVIVSFSNEGYITREEMLNICKDRGPTLVLEKEHKRYIGAQLGIYNPKGEKVGNVSHTKNIEYLFIISPNSYVNNLLKEFFGASSNENSINNNLF